MKSLKIGDLAVNKKLILREKLFESFFQLPACGILSLSKIVKIF